MRSPRLSSLVVSLVISLLSPLIVCAQTKDLRQKFANISCSPAPCVLPEVATGGLLISSFAVDPANPQQLMFGEGSGSSSAVTHSSDGGMTWTRTLLPNLGVGGTNGLAYVGYDLKGNAYAAWSDLSEPGGVSQVVASLSGDNGTSWSAPLIVAPVVDGISAAADFLFVDDDPSSPFANSIYVTTYIVNGRGQISIKLAVSNDGGATFNLQNVASPFGLSTEPLSRLATAKDGSIYITWDMPQATACSGVKILVSKSTDGGGSWTPPRTAMVVKQPPLCQLPNTNWLVNLYPTVVVDNSSGQYAGHLYVSAYNWTGTQMHVQVSSSANGGSTWGTPVRVSPTAVNDEFNPWISVSASGVVGVTWLDRRDDPANLKYRAYGAVSSNGGKTFANNLAIAGGLTDPSTGSPDTTIDLWSGTALYGIFPDSALTGTLQDVLGGIEIAH